MTDTFRKPYPPIEPLRTGRLDVGDGHVLHVEECGNPEGKPVIFLHGGPGSGCSPQHRRLFDPQRWRIVLFDQRGCGRSSPLGRLEANATWHLVADIDRIADELKLDRFTLFGGSWGATLALAYAQARPDRVEAMILRGVFSGRRAELDWFYREGASRLFPDHWARFAEHIPPEERHDLVAAYGRRLDDPDRNVRARAAARWTAWETATVMLRDRPFAPSSPGDAAPLASEGTIAFARIENHYFRHALWLEEGQLIAGAHRLADVRGRIVQGRYDVVTPAVTAYDLAAAWPGSELRIVEAAGHAFAEPGILHELLEATDAFAA
ncbi:prolyl aminopeptidase [Antarcticirhabdus aurantiaca]|uniref:Prolyl aminopeptidase n=1 Tax=Antarcticirhabdus aurantiaca TaxID=2606717 RepID=A0ACD4NXQ5_9HYPH|nr:prolyl aminopeptidase [Antarcticirhabdus aurantiaca]WAJ31508.1 prolyl aminopeptidase [Jeongeuplla avenae]